LGEQDDFDLAPASMRPPGERVVCPPMLEENADYRMKVLKEGVPAAGYLFSLFLDKIKYADK
jgi:hypothetical protein